MKFPRVAFLILLYACPALAQQVDIPMNPMVTPATPKNFKTRSVGSGMEAGASVIETPNDKVRYVTHVVLYENRFWTNTEGKPLEAKLIAFEDMIIEGVKGGPEPVMPAPPKNPTVVRDGKARLLVNKKPVVVALDTLSVADQEFIRDIQAALAKKAKEGR